MDGGWEDTSCGVVLGIRQLRGILGVGAKGYSVTCSHRAICHMTAQYLQFLDSKFRDKVISRNTFYGVKHFF